MLMKLCGRKVTVKTDDARVRPKKSEVQRLLCDRRKAGKILGWRPCWTLELGLARTVEYVRTHLADYKAGRYNV
jgi:dTDP-glucose 4,6-dehydratase